MSIKTIRFDRIFLQNFLLVLFSILLFQTCSSDNSPTEPESQPSLAEATIGSGGGTLKTDDFELSVPAGAFANDTKLTLNLIENEDSGFDNLVSREFQLEGLPQSFSQPLTIKIKYSGDLTDSSYIAIGENVWVSSLNEETISYHLLPAKESSGYVTTQIAPIDNNSSLGKSTINEVVNDGVNIYAVTNYKEYLSNEKHFNITYPSTLNESNLINLAAYLETAYTKIQDLGFSYSRRTNWPVEVTIKKLENTVYGYSTNSIWGDNYGYMEFNFDKMGDAEEMKVTAGHEFFHLVQSLYDPRNWYSKAKFQSENLWIHEALSVWSEGLFSDKTEYVSEAFSTSAGMVVYGANDSEGDAANFYGYGMSAFMKYLSDNFGSGVFVKIYDEIYNGHNSFSAIDNVIPTPTFSFWEEFIQEYLTYSIYKGEEFKPQWLASEAASTGGSFVIRYDTDTVKTFSKNYNDLSARIYSVRAVTTSLSVIDENSQLVFETEGNILGNIQLYKENKEESVFLKQGDKSVTLDNFRSFTDAGYAIIAAVTNSRLVAPYKETTSGTLTIKVKNKEVDPAPEITEIFDSNLFLNAGIKRHFSIPGKSIIIEGKNFIDDQKVFVNEVEIGSQYWYNNYGNQTRINMPPEIRGHVKIKILTASGESNEFQYLLGLPTDYLNSSDSLSVAFNLIPKANDYLGERIIEPIHLEYSGFSKNEIQWDHNIATVDIGNGDDMTGTIKVTFSDLENSTISKVVIDYAKSDKYNMHYEYAGNDYIGGDEDYYNGPGNSLAVYSNFSYSHSLKQLQPYSVSGSIRVYNPVTSKYYDVEFNELDLSATVSWVPVPENSLIFNLFHFHVD